MSDMNNNSDSSVSPKVESDIISLLKKMQQQLAFLEKKVDTLIAQGGEKGSFRKPFSKPYSKPFGRPFGDSNRSFGSGEGRREGRGNFSDSRPSRPGYGKPQRPGGFGGGKPFSGRPRREN